MPDCSCCKTFDQTPLATILPCGNRYRNPTSSKPTGNGKQQLSIREILRQINPPEWTITAQKEMLKSRPPSTDKPLPPNQEFDVPAVFSAQFPYFLGLMSQLGLDEQENAIAEVKKILVEKKVLDVPAFSKYFLGGFWDGADCKAQAAGDQALDPANYSTGNGQSLAKELKSLTDKSPDVAKIFQFVSPDLKYTWSDLDFCRFVHYVKEPKVLEAYREGFNSGLLQPGKFAQVAVFAAGEKLGQTVSAGYYRQSQREMVQAELQKIVEGLQDLGKDSAIVCHSCKATKPSDDVYKRMNHYWRYDHQPPTAFFGDRAHPELRKFIASNHQMHGAKKVSELKKGFVQRLYPQCFQCERNQSVLVAALIRWHQTLAKIKEDCGFLWDETSEVWTGAADSTLVKQSEIAVAKKFRNKPDDLAAINTFLQSADFDILNCIRTVAMPGDWKSLCTLTLHGGDKFNTRQMDKEEVEEALGDLPQVARVGAYPVGMEFERIGQVGQELGCHTCGCSEPLRGLTWIADHQPPTGLADVKLMETPQLLLPHCLACSTRQSTLMRTLVEHFNECYEIQGPPPEISDIDPEFKLRKEGNFLLAITGRRFKKSSVVLWNGAEVKPQFKKSTRLELSVSQAALDPPGTVSVTVRNNDGQVSNSKDFEIKPLKPTLSAIAPVDVVEGEPEFVLSLKGTEFMPTCAVMFGGATPDTTYKGETDLEAKVTADLIAKRGSVAVTVRNPDGQETGPLTFTVKPRPHIDSINPASIVRGSSGFTLTAIGKDFQLDAKVYWDDKLLDSKADSDKQCRGNVPDAYVSAAGTANIRVLNVGDKAPSNPVAFAILNPPPALNLLSSIQAIAGSGDLNLTLNGANFRDQAVVTFNTHAVPITASNANSLTVTVPAVELANPGTFAVQVTHADDGQQSAVTNFTVLHPPPVIPNNGLNPGDTMEGNGPFVLTVSGQHFQMGAVIRWNGAGLITQATIARDLTATVPGASVQNAGNATVTVSNPDGQVSNGVVFRIRARPVKRSPSQMDNEQFDGDDRDKPPDAKSRDRQTIGNQAAQLPVLPNDEVM